MMLSTKQKSTISFGLRDQRKTPGANRGH